MSSKRTRFVSLILVFALLAPGMIGAASAAPLAQQGTTYTVKLGDNLWTLAEKYLGNGAAYPAIAGATNDKAAQDATFANVMLLGGRRLGDPGNYYGVRATLYPVVEHLEARLALSGRLQAALSALAGKER